MRDLIDRAEAIDAIKEQIFARIDWLSDSRMERKGLDVALCVIEDLPSAQPSPCEFCKHNDTSDDVACLRCTAERRTDEHDDIFE